MKFKTLMAFAILINLMTPASSHAAVVINEFLADPPAGTAGDANGDGNRSSSEDEFIEILNTGSAMADLSYWSLSDATGTRHVFDDGTLLASMERIVVFGGGDITSFAGNAVTASGSSLSLNNSSDSIILRNGAGAIIDSVLYGSEASQDQSLVRSPEGTGAFILHVLSAQDQSLFSPGAASNPVIPPATQPVSVPETGTVSLLLTALFAGMVLNGKERFTSQSSHGLSATR